MSRNQYAWMGRRRKPGYAKNVKRYNTIFDDWLREVDMNIREAAAALDLPEERCRQMQRGVIGHRGSRRLEPSMVTRFAMSAIQAYLTPSVISSDCFELRDRLADAAIRHGLAPWERPGAPTELGPWLSASAAAASGQPATQTTAPSAPDGP